MSAPRDIANKMKRNMFGSADNIPEAVRETGQSKFYTNTPTSRPVTDRNRAMTAQTDPPRIDTDEQKKTQEPQQRNRLSTIEPDQYNKILDETDTVRRRCVSLEDKNKELNAEIGMLRSELTAARYQTQVRS